MYCKFVAHQIKGDCAVMELPAVTNSGQTFLYETAECNVHLWLKKTQSAFKTFTSHSAQGEKSKHHGKLFRTIVFNFFHGVPKQMIFFVAVKRHCNSFLSFKYFDVPNLSV